MWLKHFTKNVFTALMQCVSKNSWSFDCFIASMTWTKHVITGLSLLKNVWIDNLLLKIQIQTTNQKLRAVTSFWIIKRVSQISWYISIQLFWGQIFVLSCRKKSDIFTFTKLNITHNNIPFLFIWSENLFRIYVYR